MLKLASAPLLHSALPDLGVLRVQGADTVRFLQGQLSADVTELTESQSVLAGLHTPQGRVVAILRLVHVAPDDVLAILPRELLEPVRTRLAKFILRAKVRLADDSASWTVSGFVANAEEGLPTQTLQQTRRDSAFVVCVSTSPLRWLYIASAGSADADPQRREEWRALDIEAGLPQVYAPISEAFVGQMLNLDVLGAISFDKGCYTGQEVIARAHYRGRVKRRMQRFRSKHACRLGVGDSCSLHDGRSARVVESVQLPDGRCEFLAVAPLTAAGSDEELEPTTGSATLEVETLPLPYTLP